MWEIRFDIDISLSRMVLNKRKKTCLLFHKQYPNEGIITDFASMCSSCEMWLWELHSHQTPIVWEEHLNIEGRPRRKDGIRCHGFFRD